MGVLGESLLVPTSAAALPTPLQPGSAQWGNTTLEGVGVAEELLSFFSGAQSCVCESLAQG